ncbi:hypothetical protein LCGC14_0481190 [marine sediment metagenome]|uniref:Uncharacterized protein n=1 Tax=marine sediment metagenome TaxID=412755 RepID=A0A0F9S9E4_9ZZZZ
MVEFVRILIIFGLVILGVLFANKHQLSLSWWMQTPRYNRKNSAQVSKPIPASKSAPTRMPGL